MAFLIVRLLSRFHLCGVAFVLVRKKVNVRTVSGKAARSGTLGDDNLQGAVSAFAVKSESTTHATVAIQKRLAISHQLGAAEGFRVDPRERNEFNLIGVVFVVGHSDSDQSRIAVDCWRES